MFVKAARLLSPETYGRFPESHRSRRRQGRYYSFFSYYDIFQNFNFAKSDKLLCCFAQNHENRTNLACFSIFQNNQRHSMGARRHENA